MKNTFLADIFFHDTCSLHYDIYGVRGVENEITPKGFLLPTSGVYFKVNGTPTLLMLFP